MTTESDQLGLDLNRELADAPPPYVDPRTLPGRHSLLTKMALSPAHYEWACQQPQDHAIGIASKLGKLVTNHASDPALPLRFGTACHEMLLGRPEQVAVWSGGKRQGKEWDKFRVASADCGFATILNTKEWAHAKSVVESLRRHSRACELLFAADAVIEQRIDWSLMGKAMRSTPDARSKTTRHLADLKTTVSSEPRRFHWHSLRYYYHSQAALYRRAIAAIEGWTPEDCYIVAVEKPPPHPVTVFRFTDEALLMGDKLIRLWMEQLLACERANVWPGYSSSDVELDVPREGGDGDNAPDLVFAEVG